MRNEVNGVTGNDKPLRDDIPVVSELMRQAGYETAMIGKWHLRAEPRGFDHWIILPGQGRYFDPVFLTPDGRRTIKGFCTDVTTDLALDWLKHRKSDKPFFLMLHHKAPHAQVLDFKPDYADRYTDDLPEPATLLDDYATRVGPKIASGQNSYLTRMIQWDLDLERPTDLSDQALRHWMYQHYYKPYLRQVACLDDNIGRLLDYVDQSGLAANTVVIYTTDNGFFLGDHGWYNKMWMYEQSLHIPLLVRWPGQVKPGSINTQMVCNLDFAPTFLDIAGVEAPKCMSGRSLVPLLRGQSPDSWRDAMYYRYYAAYGVPEHDGVRTERYKLIHYPGADDYELFDLKEDPDERHNVYGQSAYQIVAAQLQDKLIQARSSVEMDVNRLKSRSIDTQHASEP
jgi:arylsulfatase A-like enzyme